MTKAIQVVIQKKSRENTELASSSHFSHWWSQSSEVNLRSKFFCPTNQQIFSAHSVQSSYYIDILNDSSRFNPSESSSSNIICSVLTRMPKTSRSYQVVNFCHWTAKCRKVNCIWCQKYSALSVTDSMYNGVSLWYECFN